MTSVQSREKLSGMPLSPWGCAPAACSSSMAELAAQAPAGTESLPKDDPFSLQPARLASSSASQAGPAPRALQRAASPPLPQPPANPALPLPSSSLPPAAPGLSSGRIQELPCPAQTLPAEQQGGKHGRSLPRSLPAGELRGTGTASSDSALAARRHRKQLPSGSAPPESFRSSKLNSGWAIHFQAPLSFLASPLSSEWALPARHDCLLCLSLEKAFNNKRCSDVSPFAWQ